MDGFGEIGVFVRVVDARNFTRAGRQLGLTASGVSRVVSRLESRLGVRLFDRTTRSVGVTADGAAYYERCTKILSDLEDANVTVARAGAVPRGRLRVDAPTVLGRFVIGPAIPRFLAAYPELSVDLSLRDHLIDPIAEGIDVVVRMAELRESELVQKKVGTMRLVVVASPRYLERRGRPREPNDLRDHDTLGFFAGPAPLAWRFRKGTQDFTVPITGRLHTNSADTIRRSAVAGLGVAQVLEIHVRKELESGKLETVLRDYQAPLRSIHALYTREKAASPKVRVFLELLASELAAKGATVARRR